MRVCVLSLSMTVFLSCLKGNFIQVNLIFKVVESEMLLTPSVYNHNGQIWIVLQYFVDELSAVLKHVRYTIKAKL